jgi:hypothetical protein
LDSPQYTCRWKRRPRQEITDYAAMMNGNSNPKVLDMQKEPILQMGSDKMIPRHIYDKHFTIRFPDRSEWKVGFQSNRKGGLIWYTDGSKTNKGTGIGVY